MEDIISEIINNKVVVASSDVLLFFLVKQHLNGSNNCLNVLPNKLTEHQFLNSVVIFTTKKEISQIPKRFHKKTIIINEQITPLMLKFLILKKQKQIDKPNKVVVGIDPGVHVGFALRVNEHLLESEEIQNLVELIKKIKEVMNLFGTKETIIKIGNGQKKYSMKIHDSIKSEIPNATIFLVDEKRTSNLSHKKNRILSNIKAAIEISKR